MNMSLINISVQFMINFMNSKLSFPWQIRLSPYSFSQHCLTIYIYVQLCWTPCQLVWYSISIRPVRLEYLSQFVQFGWNNYHNFVQFGWNIYHNSSSSAGIFITIRPVRLEYLFTSFAWSHQYYLVITTFIINTTRYSRYYITFKYLTLLHMPSGRSKKSPLNPNNNNISCCALI